MKRRLIAFLMVILFGWYITPKEIIHVFQHHVDSAHYAKQGMRIDAAHHHCTLLKVDQSLSKIEPPSFFNFCPFHCNYGSVTNWFGYSEKPLHGNEGAKKSRGPPVLMA